VLRIGGCEFDEPERLLEIVRGDGKVARSSIVNLDAGCMPAVRDGW